MKKLLYCAVAALTLWTVSCSTEAALQRLLGTDAAAPVFYGYKTQADGEVSFQFSRPVEVSSVYFDPPLEAEVSGQGETVTVRFNSSLPGGSRVTADLLVEDENRNTLNVLVNFRTRNSRMPAMVINEIRTEYSKPKAEFVELRVLAAGNLGALRLFAAYDKTEPIFEFPPVEVKAGDYIVVHTRSIEEGIVDETGSVNASKGTDASSARDFWLPGTLKLHSTNAVYLMDQDDRIIDGITLVNSKYKWKDSVAAAADEMARQGAWVGTGADNAVNSDGTTSTRTICRTAGKDTNSAADWYITVSSGVTPGTVNNTGRYKK
ncbi:hypothetical protein AGMMS50230_04040 [Spirochaetia bacterium]|nr:hypothetical protein AGMMS50230_04040 [Spirochaetia bacterium]